MNGFDNESAYVRKARTIPLRTTPDARRPRWDRDGRDAQRPAYSQPISISKPYKAQR